MELKKQKIASMFGVKKYYDIKCNDDEVIPFIKKITDMIFNTGKIFLSAYIGNNPITLHEVLNKDELLDLFNVTDVYQIRRLNLYFFDLENNQFNIKNASLEIYIENYLEYFVIVIDTKKYSDGFIQSLK